MLKFTLWIIPAAFLAASVDFTFASALLDIQQALTIR